MIAPSSSSPSDQLALVGDRVECLQELTETLPASNGVVIADTMMFFCGDKPAQQFERGRQIGGTYKCGGCGCKDVMMQDFAHATQCKWRSVEDLQTLVLEGKYGNTPGSLKPLEGLKVQDLKVELEARKISTTAMLKPDMQAKLTGLLKGVQSVHTFLVCNPTQALDSLNLSLLDCEPLRGHIHHLLQELPQLLSPLNEECSLIIETTLPKQKVSGAILRVALIKVFLRFHNHPDITQETKALLETAVKISELMYSTDSQRSPKSVLQLYNCSWLHHELFSTLITSPKNVTLQCLFGTHL